MRLGTGAELVWDTLGALGVSQVFGVPGTQTVELYDALRRSRIRSLLATNELAAAFMANGYFRASGQVGVFTTIPGPGFTYALTGVAEARLDSAAIIHLTLCPAQAPGRRFQHQAIAQRTIAEPLVKGVLDVERAGDVPDRLAAALGLALAGEPGPVLVQLTPDALRGHAARGALPSTARRAPADVGALREVVALLVAARRPVVLAGQGAASAGDLLRRVAERLRVPVITSPSGRGVLPEDHPWALGHDVAGADRGQLDALLGAADLVLVLGCKLSHNATDGFALRLPADRMIHVDEGLEVLGANYEARLLVRAPVEEVLEAVERAGDADTGSQWSPAEVSGWRERLWRDPPPSGGEPLVRGLPGRRAAELFAALRRALPRDGILVTDSGLHQVLARRYFPILAPRGLILPSDFQSMGYGVPAAIGAAVAAPGRQVVAVVGDGGFLMSGMEVATAVRGRVPVVVVVFNDGTLNLIRDQQYRQYGWSHDVDVAPLDLARFAAAAGAHFLAAGDDLESELAKAFSRREPTIVEVRLRTSLATHRARAVPLMKEGARAVLGNRFLAWLKNVRRRRP